MFYLQPASTAAATNRSPAACTSSVRVSMAFARKSGYHDTMDGDCSARNQSVASLAIMAAVR